MLAISQKDELFYDLALTFVPLVGDKMARVLLDRFGSAEAVFRASVRELFQIPGMGQQRARSVRNPEVFRKAEQELSFVVKNNIRLLREKDGDYPQKLRDCADAPLVLYYKGDLSLNASRTVAVIGTRKNTDYGQRLCEELIDGLAGQGIVVVSGLAQGIDAIAHRRCVQQGVPTIGVLGHGLDRIYPATHKALAREMLEQGGGLLSEFPCGTLPDRANFPVRNRIVAGMSDVTVVVESDAKGGAMITAFLAHGYNREVAAFPGRVSDGRSSGCNMLIRRNIASLITHAGDLMELMNWKEAARPKMLQSKLALSLSDEEQLVVQALKSRDRVHADELLLDTGLDNSKLAAALLQLELLGAVKTLAGKYYRLN